MNERRQTARKGLNKNILVMVPHIDSGYRIRPLVDLSETGVAFAPRGLDIPTGENMLLLIPDEQEDGLFFEVSGTVVHGSDAIVGVSLDTFSPEAIGAVAALLGDN